jgi:hypothetical protein
LGGKVQNLGKGLSQTAGSVRASAEEFVDWLRKSVERIPGEFLSYGERYAAFKTEALLRAPAPNESLSNSSFGRRSK